MLLNIYPAKKVLHKWVFVYILSLPGMVALNVIYHHDHCLKKSFCSIWMHSKLKSKVPLGNCVHLKRLGILGITPQKTKW